MADFTHGFWHIYIAVLTLLSIVGCGILLWSQSVHKTRPQTEHATGHATKHATEHPQPGGVETTGHVWDENLTELNTPMPRWWMWLFYITIVFGLAYLFFYPGLGSYAGKFGWNSTSAYQAELAKANADYGPLFDKYQKQDLKTVAADPQARAIGERLFLTYCAQCHGSDARGSKGFPDLTDRDWLYGGEPETIKTTILNGRNGQMPPMAAALGGDAEVENVAHYVLSLSGSTADPIKVAFGKQKFGACAACHGADGRGNPALGAPNLSDKIWLFGGGSDSIMETIRKGRTNSMPSFKDFLGEAKAHLLAAYVWNLSNESTLADKK